jgi:hypothetical protein
VERINMDERLIGTWRLVSTVSEDLTTGEKTNTWGPSPSGYINYGRDGRMIVINTGSDRRKPTVAPSDGESLALFRSMLAYAGTYEVNGNEVTHHVDSSWNEAWTGTKQVRIATFEGDNRVRLATRPAPDPVSGRMSVRTITWEKMGSATRSSSPLP